MDIIRDFKSFGHKATEVANTFLWINESKKNSVKDISLLKIVKLVYFCQGWSLAMTQKTLFKENIEAWKLGPVIRSVYFNYYDYKSKPIDKIHSNTITAKEQFDVIDFVYNCYSKLTAGQLVHITHKKNSAWDKAYTNYSEGASIALSDIYFEFKQMATQFGV